MLRAANRKDLPHIAAVHVSSWQSTYIGQVPQVYLNELSIPKRKTAWAKALEDPSHFLILAEEAGAITGFISFGKSRDPDADAYAAEVYALYLLEGSKGRGIGKQLWNNAISQLRQNSFREITLWVLDTNAAARKFYERGGLSLDGETKPATIGGQDVLELRYRIRLE